MNSFDAYFNIYIIVCGVAVQFAILYALYRFLFGARG